MTNCFFNDYFVIVMSVVGIFSVLFTGVVINPVLIVSLLFGLTALGSVRSIILKKRIQQLESNIEGE